MQRNAPLIETDRLRLREHAAKDFDDVASLWSNPEVVRHISGVPARRDESWARILRYAGLWSLLGYGYWAVETRREGRFVGEVGLADFRRQMQPPLENLPEAGWAFHPDAQGRGLATEAMEAVLSWADNSLDAEATICILNPDHARSAALAKRLGFRQLRHVQFNGAPTLVMQRPRTALREFSL